MIIHALTYSSMRLVDAQLLAPLDVVADRLHVDARARDVELVEHLDGLELDDPAAAEPAEDDVLGELGVRPGRRAERRGGADGRGTRPRGRGPRMRRRSGSRGRSKIVRRVAHSRAIRPSSTRRPNGVKAGPRAGAAAAPGAGRAGCSGRAGHRVPSQPRMQPGGLLAGTRPDLVASTRVGRPSVPGDLPGDLDPPRAGCAGVNATCQGSIGS